MVAGGSEVKQLIIAHAQSLCISDGFAEYSHYNFREIFLYVVYSPVFVLDSRMVEVLDAFETFGYG